MSSTQCFLRAIMLQQSRSTWLEWSKVAWKPVKNCVMTTACFQGKVEVRCWNCMTILFSRPVADSELLFAITKILWKARTINFLYKFNDASNNNSSGIKPSEFRWIFSFDHKFKSSIDCYASCRSLLLRQNLGWCKVN